MSQSVEKAVVPPVVHTNLVDQVMDIAKVVVSLQEKVKALDAEIDSACDWMEKLERRIKSLEGP